MGTPVEVFTHESVDAFIATLKNTGAIRGVDSAEGSRSWDLGVRFDAACDFAIKGDPSLAASATAAIDKIEIGMGNHTGWETKRDVWGERPDVGAYLTGNPFNMRRRVKAQRTTRHVSIYVCIASSCGVPASDMFTRGQTILALLESLQQMQVAVDLFLVNEGGEYRKPVNRYTVIRVESRPLDLSTAAFAIAHPAFARNLVYTYESKVSNFDGQWPADYHRSDYHAIRAAALGIGPGDILIPACHLDDPAVRNPARFVEEKINQVIGG